ncbi:MAG: DUF1640 domain-containing protein [bacterium]
MESIIYDTLAYVKKLKLVGFTDEQAEIQAEEIARILNENIVTKKDIKELEYKLKYQIITAVGGMLVGAVIIIGVLIKILQ